RGLHSLADYMSIQAVRSGVVGRHLRRREVTRAVLRESAVLVVVMLLIIWSLPFFTELVSLGGIASPLPLALIAIGLLFVLQTVYRIHHTLVSSMARTLDAAVKSAKALPSKSERKKTNPPN
ncbi:MAG: hypothetical protein HY261_04145, partial [Chloroflexi bacterium]|nr:hypothetical protein [Chloroflexota bacterium]